MASPLDDFGKTAQKLSRNPLGIIALFIVLVYGIAGLVLGVSSQNLEPSERQPLVWFLVVFPVIVLGVFYRLVTNHHTKLYAPSDYHEAEGFFRAMTPSEQKERLEREIKELEAPPVDDDGKLIAVEMESTGLLKSASVRHSWVLAEELAIREIESEAGSPVQRQVATGPDLGFDGILVQNKKLTVLEIKYARRPHWSKMIDSGIGHLQRAKDHLENVQTYILAVVVDDIGAEQRDREIARAKTRLASSSLDVQLRIYDFAELKKKYGVAD